MLVPSSSESMAMVMISSSGPIYPSMFSPLLLITQEMSAYVTPVLNTPW